MQDKFLHGMITGVLASIPQAVVSLTAYWLKLSNIRFQDFSAVFIFGHRSTGLLESLHAEAGVLIFSGLVGIILMLVFPQISSKYYILKTWFFGMTVWYFSFAIAILFQVPTLTYIDLSSAIVTFIGSSLWGVSFGIVSMKIAQLDRNNA